MGQTIVLTGMVLAAIPIGDYDKRVTILTKERGKIAAFVKGARRQGCPLTAAANSFAFGEFEVFEGKTSYRVVKADISNYFRELLEDFENVYYGFYFLEIADYYTRENAEEVEMLKLLYQSLRALEHEKLPNLLVKCIFEMKAMVLNGEFPDVFFCGCCGKQTDLISFHPNRKALFCESCEEHDRGIKLEASCLYAMQYIAQSSIEKLYTFTVSESVLNTLSKILNAYRKVNMDKRFRSLEILQQNLGFENFLLE